MIGWGVSRASLLWGHSVGPLPARVQSGLFPSAVPTLWVDTRSKASFEGQGLGRVTCADPSHQQFPASAGQAHSGVGRSSVWLAGAPRMGSQG